MTAANAAEEAAKQGKSLSIPYWRTLKAGGFLNEKYPGGSEVQKEKLETEGFKVIRKGKKYLVQNYQNFLVI
jgi:alkylated DNA nucleotide flippase Atl1